MTAKLEKGGGTFEGIKLLLCENPLPPLEEAVAAARDELGRSNYYTEPYSQPLRRLIAKRLGVPERLIHINAGSELILRQIFDRLGERVHLLTPTYALFPEIAKRYTETQLEPERDFAFDLRSLTVPQGTTLMVVVNPNNPNGGTFDMSVLPDLLTRHPETHLLVDEAFIGLGGESVVHLVPDHSNLLVTRTLSKARSLAGFRVGYAVLPRPLADALNANNDAYPLARPSQAAAIATLRHEDKIRARAAELRRWAAHASHADVLFSGGLRTPQRGRDRTAPDATWDLRKATRRCAAGTGLHAGDDRIATGQRPLPRSLEGGPLIMARTAPFETHSGRYDAWFQRHEMVYWSELLAVRAVLPWKGWGLEIGVGTGRFAAPLGVDVGLDPALAMLSRARERRIKVVQGIAEALPFRDGAFDYVLMVVVLSFLDDAQAALAEIHRVLEHGGQIVVGFLDHGCPAGRDYLARHAQELSFREATFYASTDVEKLLIKAAFHNLDWVQTLSTTPETMTEIEAARPGHGDGAFVVVKAIKN